MRVEVREGFSVPGRARGGAAAVRVRARVLSRARAPPPAGPGGRLFTAGAPPRAPARPPPAPF